MCRLQPCRTLPTGLSLEPWGSRGLFFSTADQAMWLCPDCSTTWASSVAASPLRPLCVSPPSDLALHLESLVHEVLPGPGRNYVQDSSSNCRHIKQWLLRYLHRSGNRSFISTLQDMCPNGLFPIHRSGQYASRRCSHSSVISPGRGGTGFGDKMKIIAFALCGQRWSSFLFPTYSTPCTVLCYRIFTICFLLSTSASFPMLP